MISADTLAVLMAKGLAGDDLLEVVRAIDADGEAQKAIRTKRQERNHRYYEAHKDDRRASEKRLIKTSESDAKGAPFPPYDINSTPLIPHQNIQNPREKFSEFKKAYPKRSGANPWTPAEKKFLQIVKSGTDAGEIIAGARSYAKSVAGSDPQFVAQAVTWLNQRRWLDEKPSEQTNGAARSKVFVIRGTEQWAAWLKHLGKQSMPAIERNGEYGWNFETEWPPDATIPNDPPLPDPFEARPSPRTASEREGEGHQASRPRFAYSG